MPFDGDPADDVEVPARKRRRARRITAEEHLLITVGIVVITVLCVIFMFILAWKGDENFGDLAKLALVGLGGLLAATKWKGSTDDK